MEMYDFKLMKTIKLIDVYFNWNPGDRKMASIGTESFVIKLPLEYEEYLNSFKCKMPSYKSSYVRDLVISTDKNRIYKNCQVNTITINEHHISAFIIYDYYSLTLSDKIRNIRECKLNELIDEGR